MSSASDSDNSIDWLASDDEDNESEREPDSARTPLQQQPPSSHPHPHLGDSDSSCCSSQLKEEGSSWGGISDNPSRGSPSSCTETWDSHASGLCNSARSERSKGKRTQQAQKRPHSSLATEHRERQRQLVMSNQSEKDCVFTNKCMELQCYIHPLSAILNGLRSGRYRERLSSFQESVAMDRIQRIMGVLQNPCMGERYINIILKMEEMLKSWFPNVKPRDQQTVTLTEETAPSKKPKLSPATTALSGVNLLTINAPPPPPAGAKALRVSDHAPQGAYASATNLKWLHTSPICSPTAEQAQGGPRHPPQPLRHRALTQDNAVSSSTDTRAKTDLAPRRPPLGKINAPCLERLLKSTESIITPKGAGGVTGSSWS